MAEEEKCSGYCLLCGGAGAPPLFSFYKLGYDQIMKSRFFDGFRHAFHGLGYLWREEVHFRFQAIIAIILLGSMFFLHFSYTESAFIIFAVTLVLASETVNTVIERLLDQISRKHTGWIGHIKDMMASVVLINSIGAFCIGAFTLLHYVMRIYGIGDWRSIDHAIFFALNGFAGRTAIGDALIVFFAEYLAIMFGVIFLVYLLVSCASFGRKCEQFFVVIASMIIARFGITELIRFVYPRPRPFMTYQAHQLFAEHGYSFPSGHASLFFALSMVVFFYNKPLGLCFFAASILMGIGRVMAGVHYPSDIIGGTIVGMAVALATYNGVRSLRGKI